MRPKHYLKNFLVLLPIFFSGNIFNLDYLYVGILGFILFSLVSSFIYIINDINDIENDRKHEKKKERPLAKGTISIKNAIIFAIILLIIVILINIFLVANKVSCIYLCIYLLLNLAYSFGLKEKPILDVIILSSGFLIRILYGGVLLNIPISNWLYLTILTGALYMSIGKRRNELNKNGNSTRKVLKFYSKEYLNQNLYMFLTLTMVFFSLWTIDMDNKYLIYIVPFVIMWTMKYNLDIDNSNSYGDPVEVITGDKLLLVSSVLIAFSFFIIIYIL